SIKNTSEKPNDQDYFTIGLFIPLCGSAGIWSPSCIACPELAIDEINLAGGISGKNIRVQLVDAAIETCDKIEQITDQIIENSEISAIVGMHISAIRQKLSKIILGRVPFIYTPLYEGNEKTPGIYALGETPDNQLHPALEYLSKKLKVSKWAFIGNDYVWPRTSHAHAKQFLENKNYKIAFEKYVDFGLNKFEPILDEIVKSGADAVLVSLVGQDLIDFNRAFGARKLHENIIRLSGALEENGLLAIGARNSKNLYSTASYFSNIPTARNQLFKENYYNLHGENAPSLNTLGQSIYEGIHFLAALIDEVGLEESCNLNDFKQPLSYNSIRNIRYKNNQDIQQTVYLAETKGIHFHNIIRL
ncbi:MAG: substrate-binding domain-containing protein, partial [Rhizobiales bacterium]|nr:substrate-binding domain-containing protein [Hyphomicrobiales bacterium]